MDYSQKIPSYNFMYNPPQHRRSRGPGKLITAASVVLGFGIILTILNIYELHKMKEDHMIHIQPATEGKTGTFGSKQPVVWVEGKHLGTGYLKHVFTVFDRIGYAVGDSESKWDVLWSHEYPFETLSKKLADLKPHQRVNHFPGTGYITNKVSLATSSISYIPKAFKIPSEKDTFLKYTQQHPEKLWVQKRNSHRGIKIKKIKDLDLANDGSFVQEYVDKPFLIDKRKFDIGVYTILTSIDPLRVYIVEGEVLLRFCAADYHPFDPTNTKKYVVDDNYTPVWEMPSLKNIYDDGMYTCKETLDTYLEQTGCNHLKLWEDIKDSIRQVYLHKEKELISSSARFRNVRNFFEMVRFDFVLDDQLNVYLMEVNMSPNLSSGHFWRNKRIYEHVVYNVLSLVGVAKSTSNAFEDSDLDGKDMSASDKDVTVFPMWCTERKCLTDCQSEKCSICHQCLNRDTKESFKHAFMEHINRGTCRRIFPKPVKQEEALKWSPATANEEYHSLNSRNKKMYIWFMGKCRLDPGWCF
ncbi:probable tubulin polyglutamylase ttll-15 [Pecten maximus]|uniref:probable tubulin polyglutamylase ttll-15 n=1 Tax=Pecten maximus TaxID=6579 RepID=UPI0014591A53|nr:probable tubulin polyglutamylase ttll-15 [Pecten maximus]XP_033735325.1 probable tubulin polyglutamylase ttll-15 [Pecten maximus]